MIASYPSPAGGEEFALTFDRGRACRLLVLPALFDEANKLRRFIAGVMRRLDDAGIDAFLPDLPGCNESLALLGDQTLETWREAAGAAAVHFRTTHVLSLRGGCLCEPQRGRPLRYAPTSGSSLLRALLRARVVAGKEAGLHESSEGLLERGRAEGLELAGYRLGAAMIHDLETQVTSDGEALASIGQGEVGGPGLWLRAQPDFDRRQADAFATLLAGYLR